MATCAKEYSITIPAGLTPTAWWTLNQAIGFMVEAINGSALTLNNLGTGGTFSSVPGKVSNALQMDNPGAFDATFAFSAASGNFAYNGNGCSVCLWIFAPLGYSGSIDFDYVGATSPNFFRLSLSNFNNVFCSGNVSVNGFSTGFVCPAIGAAFVPGAWNFFVFTYNGTTGEVKGSINDSALASFGLFGPSDPTPGNAGAQLAWSSAAGGAPQANLRWDEVGLFQTEITQADVDFLWNGGAGRGYPF